MIKTFIKRTTLENLVIRTKAKGYSMEAIHQLLDKLNLQIREG